MSEWQQLLLLCESFISENIYFNLIDFLRIANAFSFERPKACQMSISDMN